MIAIHRLFLELEAIFQKPVTLFHSLKLAKSGELYLGDLKISHHEDNFIYSGEIFFFVTSPQNGESHFLLEKTYNSKGCFQKESHIDPVMIGGLTPAFKVSLTFKKLTLSPPYFIHPLKEIPL